MADFTLTHVGSRRLRKPKANHDYVGDGLIQQIVDEQKESCPASGSKLGRSGVWTVREKDPITGIYVPVLRRKNVLTSYGLSSLASAIGGGYVPANYLVYDGLVSLFSASVNIGDTSVQTATNPTLAGDTSIVLSPGNASQETMGFSSITGSGPYTFALTAPTAFSHPITDYTSRAVGITDTMSSITVEQQYDSVNFPSQRFQSTAGYIAGTGNYILQFYFMGTQAVNQWFMTVGTSDTQTVGAGNLHTIYTLGYYHDCSVTAVDVEVDVSITIANA